MYVYTDMIWYDMVWCGVVYKNKKQSCITLGLLLDLVQRK